MLSEANAYLKAMNADLEKGDDAPIYEEALKARFAPSNDFEPKVFYSTPDYSLDFVPMVSIDLSQIFKKGPENE